MLKVYKFNHLIRVTIITNKRTTLKVETTKTQHCVIFCQCRITSSLSLFMLIQHSRQLTFLLLVKFQFQTKTFGWVELYI